MKHSFVRAGASPVYVTWPLMRFRDMWHVEALRYVWTGHPTHSMPASELIRTLTGWRYEDLGCEIIFPATYDRSTSGRLNYRLESWRCYERCLDDL